MIKLNKVIAQLSVITKLKNLLRPWTLEAVAIDERKRVVYAAVQHFPTGEIFAVTAEIYRDGDGLTVSGDSLSSEGEGSIHRNCPPSIIGLLTPTGDAVARQWRRDCLQRAIKSTRTSDAGRNRARELLKAL